MATAATTAAGTATAIAAAVIAATAGIAKATALAAGPAKQTKQNIISEVIDEGTFLDIIGTTQTKLDFSQSKSSSF